MNSLKLRLEAENKDLRQAQTKKSMEDARSILQVLFDCMKKFLFPQFNRKSKETESDRANCPYIDSFMEIG